MRKYHVPFWRAVGEVTPSLTLIILRKVAVKLGLDLSRISSGELIAPLKIRLWTLQESPGL